MKPLAGGRSGHDRWVISYADVMTLLLAVFATLYAAARVEAGKRDEAPAALRAEQIEPSAQPSPDGLTQYPAQTEVLLAEDALDALREQLQSELAHDIELTRAELSRDVRGLIVSLPEGATFRSGSADVTPEARDLLARLSVSLAPLPNMIRIEGHTDDRPIRTARFTSNWDLSIARAAAVVQLLIREQQFRPERLSAAGFGEFHPRVPNDTPENRTRNRRIDLVIEGTLDPQPASSR